MFFSIIIPAYNCKSTIRRVLNSILLQELEKEEYEVIVIDDNSSDGFQSILKEYDSLMNLEYHMRSNEEYTVHCPGNTRREWIKYAKGDWITFIDCDDLFEYNAFKRVKKDLIELNNPSIKLYYTKFQKWNADNTKCINDNLWHPTWLHGNFFNREFLVNNNINFKIDLVGNEDLYFENLVLSHLSGQNLLYYYVEDQNMYRWIENPNSFSHVVNNYLVKYYDDYLVANSEPYLICYKLYPHQRDHYLKQLCISLCYLYFYHQSFVYVNNQVYIKEEKIKEFLNILLSTFEITLEDLINFIYRDAKLFNDLRMNVVRDSNNGTNFIESESMKEFIHRIYNL